MKKVIPVLIMVLMALPLSAGYDEALNLFQEQRYEESLKVLADNLDVSEDMTEGAPNYKIRFLAAHVHWKLGNVQPVIAHFRRCMEIDASAVEPYIDLSLFLIERKRYSDAEGVLREGLEVEEDAMLFYGLGRIALEQRNYSRAREFFEKSNSINPELYVSYNGLGIALMNLKKYSQAVAAFSVANALRPESAELLNNLAESFEKTGRIEEAYEYISKAYEIDPDNIPIKNNYERIKAKSEK